MRPRNWNENNPNPLTRIHWRASLVPAAAVIPAPIAYIKVVAVKKLVVGSLYFLMGIISDYHLNQLYITVFTQNLLFLIE
jgi:hypothetical protein